MHGRARSPLRDSIDLVLAALDRLGPVRIRPDGTTIDDFDCTTGWYAETGGTVIVDCVASDFVSLIRVGISQHGWVLSGA